MLVDRKPFIATVIATVNISFAAIYLKLCVSPLLLIGFYRLFITCMILFPICFIKNNLKKIWNLIKNEYILITIVGVSLGLHFAVWNVSLEYISVGNSVFIVNLSPIPVSILSYFILKNRLKYIQICGIFISIFGGFIITMNDILKEMNIYGDLLAFSGAIFLSFYLVGGNKIRDKYDVIPYIFLVYLIASLTLLIINLFFLQSITLYSINDLIFIILLALFSTIFGHSLYNYAIKKIKATNISMFLLMEPILSSIFAFLILGEVPEPNLYVGGVLIIIGIFLVIKNYNKQD